MSWKYGYKRISDLNNNRERKMNGSDRGKTQGISIGTPGLNEITGSVQSLLSNVSSVSGLFSKLHFGKSLELFLLFYLMGIDG